jgi:hypothetical protein
MKLWEFSSFMLDSKCRDIFGLSDCDYLFFQHYTSKRRAKLAYPNAADAIERAACAPVGSPTFYFLEENITAHPKETVIISRFWEPITVDKKMWLDLDLGRLVEKPGGKELGDRFQERTIPTTQWRLTILINDVVVETIETPYNLSCNPFVPFIWNYDVYIQNPDLRVRSLPYTMMDAQFLYNRRNMLNFQSAESSINSGLIYEQGSIENTEVLKTAGEGIRIAVAKGSQFPQRIESFGVAPANLQMCEQQANNMTVSSGISEELLGMAKDSKSGLAEMLRQGAGLVGMQKYLDNCDSSLKIMGEKAFKLMLKNWSADKFAQVTGQPKEAVQGLFEMDLMDVGVIVGEGLYTDLQQRAEFINFAEVCALAGVKPPIKLMIDKAPIQGKAELIAAMQQQEDAEREAAQQKQAVELAVLEAELRKLNAYAVEIVERAKAYEGKALSNVSKSHELESEANKNQANAFKSNAEALEKIAPLLQTYSPNQLNALLSALAGHPIEESPPELPSAAPALHEQSELGNADGQQYGRRLSGQRVESAGNGPRESVSDQLP